MGKIIRAQRLGKGKRRKALSHKYKGVVKHQPLYLSNKEKVRGKVVDLVHDPGQTTPLAKIKWETGETNFIIAPNRLKVGDNVNYGLNAKAKRGCSLYLSQIPEGKLVYNIEAKPGDGGRFVRASGTFARVVTHDVRGIVVQLPSGTFKTLDPKCRANVGSVAGSGRTEKPFVKAGKKFHASRSRGKIYPRVSGVSMNPVDHPFGGGGHQHPGKPKSVARSTPSGRKVGSIASRKTGKKR